MTPKRDPRTKSLAAAGGVFVVQLHAARRRHYDLRLESGGVLMSWAVPKGPALDPVEKRLAVHVEDHPLAYADFEGVIPSGEYGAGAMIVWDRGMWLPLADPDAGLESGKLLFELRGHKLQGVWTLVRIKKSPNEWLLIRERRGRSGPSTARDAEELPPQSILSGLTVEQVAAGFDPAPDLVRRLAALGAPRRDVQPKNVRLMLATARREPFSRPDWVFELKLDGYRMLAVKSPDGAALISRNGRDLTRAFPDLARAIGALPYERLILDGEAVVHDDSGMPSFQSLQKRARLSREIDAVRAARRQPATFYAFDLLAASGHDLRPLPLLERKRVLLDVLPPVGPIRYVEHFAERGEDLYRRVREMGLEGIVGKAAESRYTGGRSRQWIKVRADRTRDFMIVGYTLPKGSRTGFGALHLAAFDAGKLVYTGRVGSGFDTVDLASLESDLTARGRSTPACAGPVPAGDEHRWVEPGLVCEVRYRERTADGLLRQPVFLRVRDDLEATDAGDPTDNESPRVAPTRTAAVLTNPEKIFWPEEGYTKRDLVEYYRRVSPWLLPYLRDRPLVLTRYPDGIEGKSFYQKNAPASAADWVRTVRIASESSQRDIEYFVCDDLETLLYLANLGSIPLHIWASRTASLDAPDWCILDLDPKGAPFKAVVDVALCIYQICNEIQLPCHVKTSGSTGLHILIPLAGQLDWEGSRGLGEVLARVAVAERPALATVERVISARAGKVYVDYLQNRRGQLLAAPFSARPLAGATVSTPLRWKEVTGRLGSGRFTIASVPRRMARLGADPMAGLLVERPDLGQALIRLQARLAG